MSLDKQVKKLVAMLLITWTSVVIISLVWNIHHIQESRLKFLKDTARLMFQHIQIVRNWNARHGGVYVPVTEDTQPNEYLPGNNRDLSINDQLTLTLINPAYMTRQISALAEQKNGIKFRITSLEPLREKNKPTEIEREALLSFESGSDEYTRLLKEAGNGEFFYMAPLVTTSACLKCHNQQGYELGDLRGGISIRIPDIGPAPVQGVIIGHSVIGMIGFLLILLLTMRLSATYHRIHQQSIMDALTGIPNRRHFFEHLLAEYRRASRLSTPLTIILCDIDYFKRYNDRLGHLEGDECLIRVANKINSLLHRSGDLCARYGGEEFILILPNTDLAGGERVARKIQEVIAELNIPHPDSPVSTFITMSIGVATDFRDYSSQNHLIKRADNALYRSKNLGRNRIEMADSESEDSTQ
ncbi:MAG: diguanylate cyclase [Candidatus Thiodiazotropha sp.]